MSATAALWVGLFGALTVWSLTRPAAAVSLYMLTFFAAPHLWWWGDDLPQLRYSLISGSVLALSAFLNQRRDRGNFNFVHGALLAAVLNSVFVHFVIAVDPARSFVELVEVLKFSFLILLLCSALKTRADMQFVFVALALGAGYIGYEVTFNERGMFSGGRLEGVGAPGADSANSLACLLLLTLPLMGSLLVASALWKKALTAVAAPLALNVIVLCNSRGTFLALIGSGLAFLFLARGRTRKDALKVMVLGGITLYLLLGDPQILERFTTTFAGSEDRDNSAASRLEFWKAGWAMLQDYPLGAGGASFKYTLGVQYLRLVSDLEDSRSLHNGYLTIATDWGVQGLAFFLTAMLGSLYLAYRTTEQCRKEGRAADSLIGLCVVTSTTSLLFASIFGSFLANEWGYWVIAFGLSYARIYGKPAPVSTEPDAPVASNGLVQHSA